MENGTELVMFKNELLKEMAVIIQQEIGGNTSVIPEEIQREIRKGIKSVVNDYETELAEYRDELVHLKSEMIELKKHFGLEKLAVEKMEMLNDSFEKTVEANKKIQVDVLKHVGALEESFSKAVGSVSFIEHSSKEILSAHENSLRSTINTIIPSVQSEVRGIIAKEVNPTLASFRDYRIMTEKLSGQLKRNNVMVILVYWFAAIASCFLIIPEVLFWTEKWKEIWEFLFKEENRGRIFVIGSVLAIPQIFFLLSILVSRFLRAKK